MITPRQVRQDREKHGEGKQDCGRVYQDGERSPGAECPIGEARADVDPAGNAAKQGGREIAEAQPDQEPVSIHSGITGLAHQLCAKQRIDRSDDGESQPASYHSRPKCKKRRGVCHIAKILPRHGAQRLVGDIADC